MFVHRIAGSAAALIGGAIIVALCAVIYGRIDNGPQILVHIGIPGVLLLTLAGAFGVVFGLWFAIAPGHAVRRTRGATRALRRGPLGARR